MKENRLIPKRRFKEFEGDGEWEQRKLGEIASFNKGRGYSKNDLVKKGSPIILYGRLYTNYQTVIKDINTFTESKDNSVYSLGNEVIVPSSGESADDIARASVVKSSGIILGGDLNIIRPQKHINPIVLALLISNGHGRTELSKMAQGKSVVHLYNTDLEKLYLTYPSIREQKKIGNFFKKLDSLITLQQNKLKKMKDLKSAYLSEMFPKEGEKYPKRRFAGFSGDWEECKFDKEVEFYGGLTYSPDSIVDKGTLVLRSSNVKNGEIIDADNVYVNPKVVNSCNVQKGDIIVVVRNGSRSLIGKHAQVKEKKVNTVIGAFMTGIRSSQSSFINALMDTEQFNKEIEKNLGATINQITNRMFCEMEFMFPSKKEQAQIGKFFEQLDSLITLHQNKLDKLKDLKKAYLNEMFI